MEIVAPIEAETEVVTADVAPAAEAVAEDVAEAVPDAAAVAVSAAADTAEAVTKPAKKWRTGVPPVQPKGRETIAAFIFALHDRENEKEKAGVPPLAQLIAS